MAGEPAETFHLEKHYDQLWESALSKFRAEGFEIDPLLQDSNDSRFGITLLFRPGQEVRKRITHFLLELQQIEPEQYYYPEPDLHVTVMSIISCRRGFTLKQIDSDEYLQLIRQTVQQIGSFRIDFRGVTASPSCLLIQGFPVADKLNALRNRLRENFRNSDLQQTIDSRYVLRTAHSTVARFTSPLQNASLFLDKVQQYRNYNFGSTEVRELELVYNDWYQRQALVQQLGTFKLQ